MVIILLYIPPNPLDILRKGLKCLSNKDKPKETTYFVAELAESN
jgi:hypothetical protein